TLRRDVPVELNLEDARVDALALDRLGPIFRELGFNRYQDELKALLRGPEAAAPEPTARPRELGASGGMIGGLFDEATGAEPVRPSEGDYRAVLTEADLSALVATMRAAPVISIDTETTSLAAMRASLAGLSVSVEPGTAYYIPVRSPTPERHLDER